MPSIPLAVQNSRPHRARLLPAWRPSLITRAKLRACFRANLPVDRAALRSNAAVLWIATLVVVASQAAILPWSHLSVAPSPNLSFNVCVCFILAVVGIFFTFRDFRPRLALIASSFAQLVTASIALCLLTYSLTALAGSTPLRDDVLAAMDGRIGFHWLDLLRWSDAHPRISNLAGEAYGSIAKQALAAVFVLGLRRDYRRLQSAIYAYMIALFLTSIVSFFVPALGAYAYFDVHPALHHEIALRTGAFPVDEIRGLRDHSLASFDLEKAKGIISFPSFHSALGVLFIWCFWSVPGLRWVGAALNLAMIAATPLHGSHYLTDLLAGLLIGGAAIHVSVRLHAAVGLHWGMARQHRADPVVSRPVPSAPPSTVIPSMQSGAVHAEAFASV